MNKPIPSVDVYEIFKDHGFDKEQIKQINEYLDMTIAETTRQTIRDELSSFREKMTDEFGKLKDRVANLEGSLSALTQKVDNLKVNIYIVGFALAVLIVVSDDIRKYADKFLGN